MHRPTVNLPQVLCIAIDDYHRWADNYFRGVERRNIIDKPLYHYTNMSGLKGILESGTIWFTDYRHLNDPNELVHGIAIAKSTLKRKMAAGGFRQNLFAWIDDLLNRANFDRALDFLIASFSKNRDDLSQWRAYADNGRGVAIGFSPKLFLPNDASSADPSRNVFVGPVIYDDAKTRKKNERAINVAAKIFDDALVYATRHLKQKAIGMEFIDRLSRSVLASPIIWNALTSKHQGYRHEAEVRLVMLGTRQRLKQKLLTRNRGSEVVPYVPYSVPEGSVIEVMVGPAAAKSTEEQVRKLLSSLGLKARVTSSRIPYRAL